MRSVRLYNSHSNLYSSLYLHFGFLSLTSCIAVECAGLLHTERRWATVLYYINLLEEHARPLLEPQNTEI